MGLTIIPLGIIFYLIYAYTVSILDPILTIFIGGGFALAIIAIIVGLAFNLKDFVVSIFKENKEVDHKGFKKHF